MSEVTAPAARKGVFAPALEAVLGRIAAERAAGNTPVAVFDLDDTLFSTRNRHLRMVDDALPDGLGHAEREDEKRDEVEERRPSDGRLG